MNWQLSIMNFYISICVVLFSAAFGCEYLSSDVKVLTITAPTNKTFCFDREFIAMVEGKLFELRLPEKNGLSSNIT